MKVEWSEWSVAASCVPRGSRHVRIFNRECRIESGEVADQSKLRCPGNTTTKSEPCTPARSAPYTESKESIAKGELTLKNLTIDGVVISNEVLENIIEQKGELYQELKNTTQTSLLSFYRSKNPDVERVDVTGLRVGSLVVEYVVVLKGSGKTTADLNVFPDSAVNIFPKDSVFKAETSAKFSKITGTLKK